MKIETPRRKIITVNTKNGKTKVQLIWNPNFVPNWNKRFENCQVYIDMEVLRKCDKYIPFRSGTLKNSGILGTNIGSGNVEYIAPYSRYQYYGKVMIGKPPKQVTNKDLQYNGAPQRGSFWFEIMKMNYKDTIIKGAKRYLRG